VKQFCRAALAILLLPVCYGVACSLWSLALNFKQVPEGSFYFAVGFAGYLAFQWIFFKPMRTYVFGHELTHALAAWATGGEVHQFRVSKKGGSVTVTKPNIFVALAPYMIPLYAMGLMVAYFGVNWAYNLSPYWSYFLGLLGAAMAFHAALTFFALKQNQPDLKSAGKLLSGVMIFLGNALVVVFLAGVLFPRTVSWSLFLRGAKTHTLILCENIGTTSTQAFNHSQKYINGHYPR